MWYANINLRARVAGVQTRVQHAQHVPFYMLAHIYIAYCRYISSNLLRSTYTTHIYIMLCITGVAAVAAEVHACRSSYKVLYTIATATAVEMATFFFGVCVVFAHCASSFDEA